MIQLTKLNGKEFTINCDLIYTIEVNPDTTITTTTGQKLLVRESVDEIVSRVVEFKQNIYGNLLK